MLDKSTLVTHFQQVKSSTLFVDRDREFLKLIETVVRGSKFVQIVYGPRGCGKTELFRVLCKVLSENENTLVTYFDLGSDKLNVDIEKRSLAREIWSLIRDVLSRTNVVSYAIVEIVHAILNLVREYRIEYCVYVLDELRLDSTFDSKGLIESLYNKIACSIEKNPYVTVFVLTSYHTLVLTLLPTRKCIRRFLWNLDNSSTAELCKKLNVGIDYRILYKLTGGNPREVMYIYEEGLRRWIRERTEEILANPYMRSLLSKYSSEVEKIISDIDILIELDPVREVLEKLNLVIKIPEVDDIYLSEGNPQPDKELGIGRSYAWQIPLYRIILEKAIKMKILDADIVSESIIREYLQ